MQISQLTIRNFRSLKELTLENLGQFSVFIGKNSSGKSTILESLQLFFNDFTLTGGATAGLNEYFWHDRQTSEPIDFKLKLKLDSQELTEIFPKNLLQYIRTEYPNEFEFIEIQRQIVNQQGNWKTISITWAGAPLVQNDQAQTPESVREYLSTVVVKGSDNTSVMVEVDDVDVPKVTPQDLSGIFTKLAQMVKGKLKLISAIRDVKNPVGNRVTLVDSNIQSRLWALDQSTAGTDELRYSEMESSFRELTDQRIDLAQGQIFLRKRNRRFPLYAEGGGVQATVNLVYELQSEQEKKHIFALEEPESHCHPEFQRRLFDYLKNQSKNDQIFIATHSPIFVDRSDTQNVWVVKYLESETRVERLSDLKEALSELGTRPSDVFFANRIVFVEGKSEEIIIPALAHKLGIELKDTAIIPVEGKDHSRGNLEAWIRITRNTLPFYLILDNDGKDALMQLLSKNLIEKEKAHIWQRGSIESYYPDEIIGEALATLNELYNLGMNVEEIVNKVRKGELSLDKVDLGEKRKLLPKSWEVLLAGVVANLVREKDVKISTEVRSVIERAAAV